MQSRVIQILWDEDVGDVGDFANPAGQFYRRRVVGAQVGAGHLDVDGRRQAEVQHGVHQAAGLKVRAELRQLRSHSLLHARHVFIAAHLVVLLQADLNERGVLRGVGGVNGREIRRAADVGNDHAQVPGRNFTAHQVFHFAQPVVR